MKIGAQFYTVRDFCKDLQGLSESLKKVADIGYTTVQISGTCEYDPQWLKEQLDANGLTCVLTHIPAAKLTADAVAVAKNHDVFGCRCVGLGYYGFKEEIPEETFENFLKTYVPVAETLKENGKYFMYHNHDREFIKRDGKITLAHLAENIPADLMGFTFDTYWAQKGGADPAYWIEKLAGRVPVIHLKDYAFDAQMAVVGEGNINFDRVFQAAEKAGTEYMLVEQDNCNGEDPFACLARSYAYLKSKGFD